MPASSEPSAAPDLEKAIAQLDAILAEMEDGKLPLDGLISRYEQGVKLVKQCQEQLKQAERRIQIVTQEANGAFALKEFKTDDDE